MKANQFCIEVLKTTLKGINSGFMYTFELSNIDLDNRIANWKWAKIETKVSPNKIKKQKFVDAFDDLWNIINSLDSQELLPSLPICLSYLEKLQICLQNICRRYACLKKEIQEKGHTPDTQGDILFSSLSNLLDRLVMVNLGANGEAIKTEKELYQAYASFFRNVQSLLYDNLSTALKHDNQLYLTKPQKLTPKESRLPPISSLHQTLLENADTDSDTDLNSSRSSSTSDEGGYTPPRLSFLSLPPAPIASGEKMVKPLAFPLFEIPSTLSFSYRS